MLYGLVVGADASITSIDRPSRQFVGGKRGCSMRYEIVTADSPEQLSEQVNERLASGWELYGNFTAVVPNGSEPVRFLQPMIFKEVDRGFPLKKRNLRIA